MSSIDVLQKRNNELTNQGQFVLNKVQDIQYRIKVAEVQNDEQQISALTAELTVLNKMMLETTAEIESNNASIEPLRKEFIAKKNQLSRYKAHALVASLLCFFMPNFGLGLAFLAACLGLAFYFDSQSNDQQAYAAGYSVDEWKKRKVEISAEVETERKNRDALAKAIADHLKK